MVEWGRCTCLGSWKGLPTFNMHFFSSVRPCVQVGDLERAQQQLELALSFNSSSSDAGLIKSAIEKLSVHEEEEEEEL